jgi:hypothetical protein
MPGVAQQRGSSITTSSMRTFSDSSPRRPRPAAVVVAKGRRQRRVAASCQPFIPPRGARSVGPVRPAQRLTRIDGCQIRSPIPRRLGVQGAFGTGAAVRVPRVSSKVQPSTSTGWPASPASLIGGRSCATTGARTRSATAVGRASARTGRSGNPSGGDPLRLPPHRDPTMRLKITLSPVGGASLREAIIRRGSGGRQADPRPTVAKPLLHEQDSLRRPRNGLGGLTRRRPIGCPRLPPENPCGPLTISDKWRSSGGVVCAGQCHLSTTNDKPGTVTVGKKRSWVQIPPPDKGQSSDQRFRWSEL